jgi:hypothetical protein
VAKAIRPNSEYFDALAGDILNRLNLHFPEPITLVVDDEVISHLGLEEDYDGRLKILYPATIKWLADEGFLRFSSDTITELGEDGEFFDVVLSAKGRAFLVEDGRGERLQAAAKAIGTEAGKRTISEIVGQAVQFASRMMLGG